MKRLLSLDYTVPTGRLTPYFDALSKGQALAAKCADCGRVAFPPALTCASCGGSRWDWLALSGAATVLYRTDTPDSAFALAHFDGADTATLVRLADHFPTTTRGRLVPPQDDAGLWLALEEPEDEDRTVR